MQLPRATWWSAAVVALGLAACGRTELEAPEDIPVPDASDVVTDRPDVPDVVCRTNRDCDDGVFCNGTEQCVASACQPGIPVACDDGVACTRDSCDEGTGTCVSAPDNTRCVAPAVCDIRRGCTSTACMTDAQCDDGNVCNGRETCAAGACVSSGPLRCDDGIACTQDQCDPRLGCTATPDNRRCDDGVFCNGSEICSTAARGCTGGMPVVCEDGNPCTTERCDEMSRSCSVVGRTDADNDGFLPARCGGNDCDDNNSNVNPGRPEGTPGTCLDGLDNNCNGLPDCRDPACAMTRECLACMPTGPEGPPGTCRDGRDNDCNRLLDCADPVCARSPECGMCMPTGPERGPMACADGRDNDCNGTTDCADPQCAMIPACVMCVPTGAEGAGATCTDGRDNDCNGALDCADGACAMNPACIPTNEDCATARGMALPSSVSGTTVGARNDFSPMCAGSMTGDVVWVFRNPTRQTITIDTEGSAFDTMLLVRRDNCMGPDLACDDDSGTGTNSRIVLTNADPGTYFVVVDGFGGNSGAYRLNLRLGSAEVCDNMADDDGDGQIDCLDPDCAAFPDCSACMPTAPVETGLCVGGRDEDCDGQIDCLDPDCRLDPSCGGCVPTGPENNAAACTDGRDNDCNRLLDCADPGCRGVPGCACVPTGPENNIAACGDGRDNDCDGSIDCGDAECAMAPMCVMCVPTGPENTAAACTDGRDNDCDRTTDCADTQCATQLVCCRPTGAENTAAACSDGRDNDCDGRNDCADSDCSGVGMCACVVAPEVCTDGADQDCDRLIDCADPDCAMNPACVMCVPTGREADDVACSDGTDNDCDRLTDCADSECASAFVCCRATGAENTDAACADGMDNDCDRAVDCLDPGCAMTRPCRMVPPNDTCSGAQMVAVPSVTTGTTVGATNDVQPVISGFPGCAGGAGPDVVYTFNITARTPLTIDVASTSGGYDPVVHVRRAPCETGTQLACNDDAVGTDARVAFVADPGTYFVFVDGFNMTSQGAFRLSIGVGLPAENCGNGRDDDADMLVDCADTDCSADPRCVMCMPTGPENTAAACADGRDNDCDRLTDCADPNCSTQPACCRPTGPESGAIACSDGRDNDCNMRVDCADPACASEPACCVASGPENTAAACSDGRDNDCDRQVDCADPNCSTQPACCRPTGREGGLAACTDGVDNDCDGQLDCNDTECRPLAAVGGNECCNGRDDDGNGVVDEFACVCATNMDCAGVGGGGMFPSPACYLTLPLPAPPVCGIDCRTLGGNMFCNGLSPGWRCNMTTGACTP
jgi:hypothetical protein